MSSKLKRYLIPHQENNYKPKLFEYASLSIVLAVAIVLFLGSVSVNNFIKHTNQGAAVYSSVLVDLTNDVRKEQNQPLLALNTTLVKAAELKASDMAEKGYFAHNSPEGLTPWYFITQAGYRFSLAGENLAIDFNESEDVENAWMNSPAHRANLLDSRFTEIGIAVKEGMYQGRTTTFVVQMFGKPVFAAPTETITPKPEIVPLAEKPVSPKIVTTTTPQPEAGQPPAETQKVEGASTEPNVSVINETPNTIVAENKDVVSVIPSEQSAATENSGSYASTLDTALVKSPTYARYALLAIAGLLVLGLILFIFIEIKRQHPWQIFLGVISLVIIILLSFALKSYILIPF